MRASEEISAYRSGHFAFSEVGETFIDGFQPEPILPNQFFTHLRDTTGTLDRNRKLCLALLEDAIHVYQKYAFSRSAKGQRLATEAEEWMGLRTLPSPDNSEGYPVPFEDACNTLELDPNYLRRGLRDWYRSRRGAANDDESL